MTHIDMAHMTHMTVKEPGATAMQENDPFDFEILAIPCTGVVRYGKTCAMCGTLEKSSKPSTETPARQF